MTARITTFLMFDGRAEEAMNFYVTLFPDSKIVGITRYGAEGPGAEGSVMHAVVNLAGQHLMFIDSAVKHPFTFTPAISLYVTCSSGTEIAILAEKLADTVLSLPMGPHMPLDAVDEVCAVIRRTLA